MLRERTGNKKNMLANHDMALVPVKGDLDERTASALRSTLDELRLSGCRRVIVNMAEVPHVDSSGMAVIVGAIRSMRQVGGLLSLVNVTPNVLHALRVARLVDFVPVSAMGQAREVHELAPDVNPLWRMTLPVKSDGLQATRTRIEELAGRLGFSADEVFDLTLAAGEAMGNAVDHTTGEGVMVTASGYPDRMVVEVSDRGEGFDEREAAWPANGVNCERGRGLKLMRLLVDSCTITARPGGAGTLVRLVKLV